MIGLPSFWSLMRSIYPTIPNKPILFLGLLFCLFNGSMTHFLHINVTFGSLTIDDDNIAFLGCWSFHTATTGAFHSSQTLGDRTVTSFNGRSPTGKTLTSPDKLLNFDFSNNFPTP